MLSDLGLHVLLALGEGPSHGYAIGKAIEDQSGGRLNPTTGAGRPPPLFTLTARGRRAASGEAAGLDALVRTARKRRLFPQRA
jgi:hypothetical protein